jgi:hypothetical protein
MEWRCVPRGQVKSFASALRDAKAVQQWFPEWETWPLSRRRLWGFDLLAGAQGFSLPVSVSQSTVVRKASM